MRAVNYPPDVYLPVFPSYKNAGLLGHLKHLAQQEVKKIHILEPLTAELAQRCRVNGHGLRLYIQKELIGHVDTHILYQVHIRKLGNGL